MPHPVPKGYENKYAEFIRLCEQAKNDSVDQVVIAQPWVLGDTYDEIIEMVRHRLVKKGLPDDFHMVLA